MQLVVEGPLKQKSSQTLDNTYWELKILSVELLVCLHVGFESLLVLEGLGADGTLQHPVLAVGADVSLEKIAVGELYVAELAQQ